MNFAGLTAETALALVVASCGGRSTADRSATEQGGAADSAAMSGASTTAGGTSIGGSHAAADSTDASSGAPSSGGATVSPPTVSDVCNSYTQAPAQATITAAITLSTTDEDYAAALSGTFTACRNDECYSGRLSGSTWSVKTDSASISLGVGGGGRAGTVALTWVVPMTASTQATSGDRYRLIYAPTASGGTVTIFDTKATYRDQIVLACENAFVAVVNLTAPIAIPGQSSSGDGGAGGSSE